MTVDRFIAMQQEVIADGGFDGFLPVIVVETRRAVRVKLLEDVPDDVDIERFVKDWAAAATNRKQDYLLAFKVDDKHFKVVCRVGATTHERLVLVDTE